MDLELTISGLCVLVLTADEERPVRPKAVDVLMVDVRDCTEHVHMPRLSYRPSEGPQRIGDLKPAMHIDPEGHKHASIDLTDLVVGLECGTEDRSFRLDWAHETKNSSPRPTGELSERLIDWVPPAESLGITRVRVPADSNDLPQGVAARLTLPPGELFARNVARDVNHRPILWDFRAGNESSLRAVANQVVFRATNVNSTIFTFRSKDSESQLFMSAIDRTLRVGFSNDVAMVPDNVAEPQRSLEHLKMLDRITPDRVAIEAPKIDPSSEISGGRTIRPICPMIRFITSPT